MTQESPQRPLNVSRAVRQKLESLKGAGISHVPKAKARTARAAAASVSPPRAVTAAKPVPAMTMAALPVVRAAQVAPVMADESREAALAAVARRVAACTRCADLAASRTQTVFGTGNPHSNLVFLGEAPGADEDREGKPFVGRCGQLLTDIITKGMQLRREDVYIMNILRCRPPNNRPPLPVEAASCREYLDAQLAIVRPKFICCLGATAAQNLLQVDTAIGHLRGRMIDFQGMRVLCTYHPAYLLRTPSAKRIVWDDIQILMAEMGLKSG